MKTRIQLQAGRGSVPSLGLLLGLALLSFNIFAAPPNAPVFTALDDQELNPPNPDGRYSLDDAIRGLPFTVDTPAPPQIVAEQVVTPSTLGNYINTAGMRLILTAGNYGSITIGGTDKEIVLTTGVATGDITISGQRIVVKADPARTGTIRRFVVNDFAADVLLDGINVEKIEDSESSLWWVCDRVALINSRVRAIRWPIGSFPTGGGGATNLIVANNQLISYGGQGPRITSAQNLAFVDNRIYEEVNSSSLRLHAGSSGQRADNIYVGRNQFEGGFWQVWPVGDGATSDNTLGMGTVWIEDNNIYSSVNGWFMRTNGAGTGRPLLNDVSVDVIYIRDNNLYNTSGLWPGRNDNTWVATISNPPVQSTTTAPAWEHQ